MIRRASAFFFPVFLLFAVSVFADDSVLCKTKYSLHKKEILADLDKMETDYTAFRWAEFKTRRVMYEQLWQSRTDGNDPLSKNKRAEGQEEEKRLRDVLRSLQQDSEKASNGFVETLGGLEHADSAAPSLCVRPDFRACLAQNYEPFYLLLKQLRETFEHIFEQEREYRKAAEDASGGRETAYLYSALEKPGEHTDFFWRFENGRAQQRFEEDSKIMDFILQMRKLLTGGFPGDNCCFQCV